MRFTFLGTSAGVPTRTRNVTGLTLAIDDSRDWYLVDCGEATQHQLLHTRYSTARLQAVFITHVHGDHCYGLPGLIASANMSGRREPLTICAPDGIQQFLEAVIAHTDLTRLRFPIHFVRSDVADFHFEDERVRVTATELSHRVPCFAYRFEEKPRVIVDHNVLEELGVPKGPLWGELQHDHPIELDDGRTITPAEVKHAAWPARSVVVAGDNDRPALLIDDMKASDVLIHEATFTEDVLERVGPQYMHSTAAMVARSAREAQLPNLVLTHFSQRYRLKEVEGQRSLRELRDEAAANYGGNLVMARDLASFEIQRDHTMTAVDNSPGH